MKIHGPDQLQLNTIGYKFGLDSEQIATQVLEDSLELSSKSPKRVVQVLDDRIEIVGGRKQRREVVEERLEAGGEILRSDVQTIIDELPLDAGEAAVAHSGLDPERLRSLLFGD